MKLIQTTRSLFFKKYKEKRIQSNKKIHFFLILNKKRVFLSFQYFTNKLYNKAF